jgi:amino acid transporter
MGLRLQRNPSGPPLNPKRKRIAIIAASVAFLSAPGAWLFRRMPTLQWIWLLLMIGLLIYLGIELTRMRQQSRRGW